MHKEFLHYPFAPIALKVAVSVAIGMLTGMEREWSNKDFGVRTFALASLMGMLSSFLGEGFEIAGLAVVLMLITLTNVRNIIREQSLEVTTSVALAVTYILGILVGIGHIFTPVAGAIVMTMLLAWKTELNRFAGGLTPSEIRSAILLGLLGFVIYPILPDHYIDRWNLFNPSDAWISIIAIAGIGFINYVLLRIFSKKGLYLGAVFGGLVNSSATVAEVCERAQQSGMSSQTSILCLTTTIAMFVRNLVLATLFAPSTLAATMVPLVVMSLIAAFCIWRDYRNINISAADTGTLKLDSPISIKKISGFGILFIVIQVASILLTRLLGNYGLLATGFVGGLVSSASATVAAATMAKHGSISASLAGNATVLASLASALINLPIVWKLCLDKRISRKLTFELCAVVLAGILAVVADRSIHLSELILNP